MKMPFCTSIASSHQYLYIADISPTHIFRKTQKTHEIIGAVHLLTGCFHSVVHLQWVTVKDLKRPSKIKMLEVVFGVKNFLVQGIRHFGYLSTTNSLFSEES